MVKGGAQVLNGHFVAKGAALIEITPRRFCEQGPRQFDDIFAQCRRASRTGCFGLHHMAIGLRSHYIICTKIAQVWQEVFQISETRIIHRGARSGFARRKSGGQRFIIIKNHALEQRVQIL
jgi:hypothetical protein